jgi:uncharacterized protein
MTIAELSARKLLLLDCVSGSRAYGLDTPLSDTDLKGVFLLPKQEYYGVAYTEQVNSESNDEVYYELKRFVQLLVNSNPNILELLSTPEDCIRYRHPVMDLLKPGLFLSKQCKHAFAGYAQAQIKKAKGLNKKILNPVDKERKSVLDFCFVLQGQVAVSLATWLLKMGFEQQHCGLVKIDHMRDMYAVFHNSQLREGYLTGISSGPAANDVSLSPVEKGISPVGILSFNRDGYSRYCKDYSEYWEWVEKRNEVRYENTMQHGKNYDAKNMMHTFRLLNMAEEIALERKINVRRHDREFLLHIRSGAYSYEDLVAMADEKIHGIDELYERSGLPEEPDFEAAGRILVAMREELYRAG